MTFDLAGLIARRRGEQSTLYSQYVSAAKVRAAKQMGLGQHFVRADGCWVFDGAGERYLDCDAGSAVFAVGRNDPRVHRAISDVRDLAPANWVARATPLLAGLLAEALVARMPEGLGRVLFTNAGAETVEAAIKFARKSTGRSRVLFLEGDFHGLTYGALSLTDSGSRLPLMEQGFGPLLPGCQSLAWGDIEQLRQELALGDVAALIVEPVQGASVRVLEPAYLQAARALCDRHGALLVADEILTGLGRTGRFLGCEHAGVTPDLVLLAKALSGGAMPVGALIVRTTLHDGLARKGNGFVHASTFGENDYCMAAGLATLAIIDADDLVARAERMGRSLLEGLRELQARHPMIAEVRGRGLLAGLVLRAPGQWLRQPVAMLLERRGVLGHLCVASLTINHRILAAAPTRNNVIRFHPPLTIDEAQLTLLLTAIDAVLTEAERFPDGVGRMAFARMLDSVT